MLGPDEVIESITQGYTQTKQISEEIQQNYGIIPRTTLDLFNLINEALSKEEGTQFVISVKYFEIYNEHIFDLLSPTRLECNLKEIKSKIEVTCDSYSVSSPLDIFKLLAAG